MAIMRVEKTKNFTIVSNVVNNDSRISNAARGLLHVMLSKPDDWKFTIENLMKVSTDKRGKIRTELKELQEAGYLEVRKLLPNESRTGRLEYEYHVYEIPKHCKYLENGDIFDTITGQNITMNISNDRISSHAEKEIAKAIFKYIQRHSNFKGTTKELIALLPKDLNLYEGYFSKQLNKIEPILFDQYDIVVERKRNKGKRILYIYFHDDMIESNNADQLEEDKTFIDEENKENMFHQYFCEDTYNTENDEMQEENEGCQFKVQKLNAVPTPQQNDEVGVSVQGVKFKRCELISADQTLQIERHNNTNKVRTKELSTEEQKRSVAINSINELDSGLPEDGKEEKSQVKSLKVQEVAEEKKNAPVLETGKEKKPEEIEKKKKGNTEEKNPIVSDLAMPNEGQAEKSRLSVQEVAGESKRGTAAAANEKKPSQYDRFEKYLPLIAKISEDRSVKNNFILFLDMREKKLHLSTDPNVVKNLLKQLKTYATDNSNSRFEVSDEAMNLILTNALVNERGNFWTLKAQEWSQIRKKVNGNKPLWSPDKDMPTLSKEEEEEWTKRTLSNLELMRAQMRKEAEEEKKKKGNGMYGALRAI